LVTHLYDEADPDVTLWRVTKVIVFPFVAITVLGLAHLHVRTRVGVIRSFFFRAVKQRGHGEIGKLDGVSEWVVNTGHRNNGLPTRVVKGSVGRV
jgi:hypothetical protein